MAAWWAPIYFWFKFAVLIYNGCFQKFRFVKSDGINCFQDRRINSYFFPDLPIIVGLTAWLNLGWHDSFLYDQYTIWPFFGKVLDHFLDALRLIVSLIHGDAETFWYDRPYQIEQILDVPGIWINMVTSWLAYRWKSTSSNLAPNYYNVSFRILCNETYFLSSVCQDCQVR